MKTQNPTEAVKHTPGPWKNRKGSGVISSGKWHKLATAHTTGTTGERDANARLIAAAPELLEACKQAESLFANITQLSRPDYAVGVSALVSAASDAMKKMQAAIARAAAQ